MLRPVFFLALSVTPRLATSLRQVRLKQNYSQERLAHKVGVSRQTIVNIEKGTTVPNVLLALDIAAALAIAVEKLFKPVGREPDHPSALVEGTHSTRQSDR
jgi:putative transcriptional regulator